MIFSEEEQKYLDPRAGPLGDVKSGAQQIQALKESPPRLLSWNALCLQQWKATS